MFMMCVKVDVSSFVCAPKYSVHFVPDDDNPTGLETWAFIQALVENGFTREFFATVLDKVISTFNEIFSGM